MSKSTEPYKRSGTPTYADSAEGAERYVQEAIDRYRDGDYARKYKQEYTDGLSPKNLTSRVIASREVAVLRRLLRGLGLRGDTVLDIPCGTGKLGPLFREFSVSVIAADVSLKMMALAEGEYDAEQLVRCVECDARELPFESQSIDVVVCLRLFQRLPAVARREVLEEFRRVVSGHLLISYSYTSHLQRARRAVRSLLVPENGSFFQLLPEAIQNEIEETGFKVIKKRSVFPGLSSELVFHARVGSIS